MILVAGGDSFVFGDELKDQFGGPSLSTYSALLAKENNMQYICAAWPGNANNAISRMTIKYCNSLHQQNAKFGVIVTWSFCNRYEFRFNYPTKQRLGNWYTINSWSIVDNVGEIEQEFKNNDQYTLSKIKLNIANAKKVGMSEFARVFYKHVGNSEYYELYTSLKEIVFLQYYLEKNKIPFMFLTADNLYFEHESYHRHKDENLSTLYNEIDWTKWFFFPSGKNANETIGPRGFYQWAVENKYPCGATHPLEEAHKDAFKLIKEQFNDLVTKPLEQNSIRN